MKGMEFPGHQATNNALCASLGWKVHLGYVSLCADGRCQATCTWCSFLRQNLHSFMAIHSNFTPGNTYNLHAFTSYRSKALPATMESSILLPWVKGDSVEAEAINWPPMALLSNPSISVKEKGSGFSLKKHYSQKQIWSQYSHFTPTNVQFSLTQPSVFFIKAFFCLWCMHFDLKK